MSDEDIELTLNGWMDIRKVLKESVKLTQVPWVMWNIYTVNRVKSNDETLLYTVDAVNEAITRERKISFKYTDYTPEKKKVFKHDGEVYTLSP